MPDGPGATRERTELNQVERLVGWLARRIADARAEGAVVGLSGGVDSALVAHLLARAAPGRVLGLLMPCHSDPADEASGRLAGESAGIAVERVDLGPAYDALVAILPAGEGPRAELARANVKPRLRMLTLYHYAALRRALVVGTGNRSELAVGYFTKYGDGGVDLLPLGRLTKTEVWELAREVGVPSSIIERPPSAGLWSGQTDEGEMGLTYQDLDAVLRGERVSEPVARRVRELQQRSAHKRSLPPMPPE